MSRTFLGCKLGFRKYSGDEPLSIHSADLFAFRSINVEPIYSIFTLPMSFKWAEIVEMDTWSCSESSRTVVYGFLSTKVLSSSLLVEWFRPQPSSSRRSKYPKRNFAKPTPYCGFCCTILTKCSIYVSGCLSSTIPESGTH